MDDVDAGPQLPPTARRGGGHGARRGRGSWRRGGAQARLGQLDSLLRPAAGLLRRPAGLRLRPAGSAASLLLRPRERERDGWREWVPVAPYPNAREREREMDGVRLFG